MFVCCFENAREVEKSIGDCCRLSLCLCVVFKMEEKGDKVWVAVVGCLSFCALGTADRGLSLRWGGGVAVAVVFSPTNTKTSNTQALLSLSLSPNDCPVLCVSEPERHGFARAHHVSGD